MKYHFGKAPRFRRISLRSKEPRTGPSHEAVFRVLSVGYQFHMIHPFAIHSSAISPTRTLLSFYYTY